MRLRWKHVVYDYSAGWNDYVAFKIERWEDLYTKWITQTSNGIVLIQYEDMLDSQKQPGVIENILQFLKLFHADQERMRCLSANHEGKFHRKNKSKKVRCAPDTSNQYFTDEQKSLIDSAIDRLSNLVSIYLPGQKVNLEKYRSTVVELC